MNNKIIFCFTAIVLSLIPLQVKADSPLTSTYFATFYYEYPIVNIAETTRGLNDEIMAYLADPENPIDVKAAVINAIGWNYDATTNAAKFWDYLAAKKGVSSEQLLLPNLSGHELLCYGYLLGMDNYFEVDAAIYALEQAVAREPQSTTANLILAMTRAQKAMDYDFCAVWRYTSEVLKDSSLKRDMKTAAIQSIVDYMILYKSSCSE